MRREFSLLFVVGLIAGVTACNGEHPAPPKIEHEPQDVSVAECGGATFAVGATGEVPLTYRWSIDGAPVTPAIGQVSADGRRLDLRVGLASDGRKVKVEVSNSAGRAVSREAVLSVTAAPSPVLIVPAAHAMGLATDGVDVYWTDGAGVRAASVSCDGPVRTLYERSSTKETVAWMALAGDRVLWVDYAQGFVNSTVKDGSETTTLASGRLVLGLVGAGENAYWIAQTGIEGAPLTGGGVRVLLGQGVNSDGLAADDAYLYWYDLKAGTITRRSLDGAGDGVILATGLVHPAGLAAGGGEVYWSDTDATAALRGSISRVSREGGAPVVLARQDTGVGRLVLDGEFVYWTGGTFDDPGSGSVRRVRVDGSGSVEVLLSGLDGPFYLAVDNEHVYVRDQAGIWRIDKPVP